MTDTTEMNYAEVRAPPARGPARPPARPPGRTKRRTPAQRTWRQPPLFSALAGGGGRVEVEVVHPQAL